MEGRLLEQVLKKDEDAVIHYVVNENDQVQDVVLETSVDLSGIEPWTVRVDRWCGAHSMTLLNSELLHEEARAPPVRMHVRVVRHVFMANLFFLGIALVVGMAFYYWSMPWLALVLLVSVGAVLFSMLYMALVTQRKEVEYGWWEAGCVALATLAGVMVGCTAGLLGNIAPFEWLATLWAQTIMVLVYAVWTPREPDTNVLALDLLMAAATLCVWALAIVAAFEAHDWVASGVVLVLSVCALFYHSVWVRRALATSYGHSWRDLTVATMEFYGLPVVLLQPVIMRSTH